MATPRVPPATVVVTKPSSETTKATVAKSETAYVTTKPTNEDMASSTGAKQIMNGVGRQTDRRHGSANGPMSNEEKLELAGRTAANAMGRDRTSKACVIL